MHIIRKTVGLGAGLLSAVVMTAQMAAGDEIGRVRAVSDRTTFAECSACHMAYPPALLPAASWDKIMATLSDHFGEDASLDPATTKHIRDYLVANAGRVPRGVDPAAPPLRIDEMPWFRHEHGRRTFARAKSDPNIGSIANCAACHRGVDRGYFED